MAAPDPSAFESADPLVLDAVPITIADVVRVARAGARVVVGERARARVTAAARVLAAAAMGDAPVYGLTTGLGAGVDTRVGLAERLAFQQRVPQARAVAVGPPIPTDHVRAMMLVRASTICAIGHPAAAGGVSAEALDALLAALNARVHPLIPSIGSIGAADLSPLAHMAMALMGMGMAEHRGAVLPAVDALASAGLSPLSLGPKDGHGLIVVNALSAGHGALVLADAAVALRAIEAGLALSCEALRAKLSPFDPRVQAARPAPGAVEAARRLMGLLGGSGLRVPDPRRTVHDPLSFRSATQVHGAALDAWERARSLVELELNAPSDNPLVLIDGEDILHHSNFDVTALALSFETLGQALAHGAAAAVWRAIKLMSPRFSELPRFLTPLGQTRTGFATVQKTLSALEAEIRHLALPCSLTPLPVADGQEDVAQMASLAVDKTGRIVERLRWIAAIGFVVAAQAAELRPVPPETMGAGARMAYRFTRRHVEPLADDRSMGPDFDRLAEAIAEGELDRSLRDIVPTVW